MIFGGCPGLGQGTVAAGFAQVPGRALGAAVGLGLPSSSTGLKATDAVLPSPRAPPAP